jgi:RNA 2',3'-cyclic 3'-phosphodiesterase
MGSFETARAFVALNVDVVGVRRLLDAVSALRKLPDAPELRWVAPPRLHLTLKFLGEIDIGTVPVLVEALSMVASQHPSPRLVFTHFGAFPTPDAARVVFAEPDDSGGATEGLAMAVDVACAELGFARETRPFHAHVTVARSPVPVPVNDWLARGEPWRVSSKASELVLYRSEVGKRDAEYEALGRLPFGFAARPSMPAL